MSDNGFVIQMTAAYSAWVHGLRDRHARARIAVRIDRLAGGHWGDAKSVGAGVVELRIDYGPGYRVYLTRRGGRLVLLLCGGDKSSQDRDIARAQAMVKELED